MIAFVPPPGYLCTSRLEGSLKRLFPVLVQQPLPELKCRLRPGFLPPVEPSRDRGLRDSEVAHKCRFPAPFGLAEGEEVFPEGRPFRGEVWIHRKCMVLG